MRKISQITPDEDTPLLLSWHRGDLSAFETLIWKYQTRIFNLAHLLTGVQKTAAEVTENAFIAAYRNIRSLKSTGRFSSWLVAITLKECRELATYRGEESDLPKDPEPELADEDNYSAALHKKLELCIRELPVELSEPILLRYVRGYSLDRVEEILQISGDLLLSRLFEAQETLACWLKSDTEDPAELSALKKAVSSVHPEIRRNFSAYLDGTTEGDEKELTKAHLKSCGSCREALAELEWMVEDIKSIPDIEPPLGLAARILLKVRDFPAPKPVLRTGPSQLKIQVVLATLFIAFVGAVAYFWQSRSLPLSEPPRNQQRPVPSPAVEQKVEPAETGLTSILKGVFRGNVTPPTKSPGSENTSRPSLPLPPLSPPDGASQTAPAIKPLLPAVDGQGESGQKEEKPEAHSPLLQEWGDSPPPSNLPQKKVSLPRVRAEELAIVLHSADSVAAAHDIEKAITASGGKVNGRAYSGGTDIIYTRVEVDRFFDLMGRLGKIGKIQELPQLPEGAEGAVDLVIRW